MAFVQSDASAGFEILPDVGPALWPVAMPPWMDALALQFPNKRAAKVSLFALVVGLHTLALTGPLIYRDINKLREVGEQSRLTMIRLAAVAKPSVPGRDKPDAPQAAQPKAASPSPTVPIEWTRVRNWQPPTASLSLRKGSAGGASDATSLLAGLGAAGPAGANDGVIDPYAGASPIWSGKGAKSALLLAGAPNPVVLDEIRTHIARRFPALNGYARIIVSVDKNGVITTVIKMDSDLPQSVREMLQEALLGRVVADANDGSLLRLNLPEIIFGYF